MGWSQEHGQGLPCGWQEPRTRSIFPRHIIRALRGERPRLKPASHYFYFIILRFYSQCIQGVDLATRPLCWAPPKLLKGEVLHSSPYFKCRIQCGFYHTHGGVQPSPQSNFGSLFSTLKETTHRLLLPSPLQTPPSPWPAASWLLASVLLPVLDIAMVSSWWALFLSRMLAKPTQLAVRLMHLLFAYSTFCPLSGLFPALGLLQIMPLWAIKFPL